jgi:hypothetical protein
MTNGDKLRQMSNEELAEVIDYYGCNYCMQGNYCDTSCREGIKAYLDMEIQE